MGSSNPLPVAILGATGLVGQKVISLIQQDDRFHVAEVTASERNVGRRYGDAVNWRDENPLPQEVANLAVTSVNAVQSRYIISALPADVALQMERTLAARGHVVFSNASANRLEADVPLLIPEVNQAHLQLLDNQEGPGRVITNPNCVVAFVALALAPLIDLGPIEHVSVVTLQAVSGCGYPGISSLDVLGNVIPHIEGEEEKIGREVRKILGSSDQQATFGVTAHVHRVPVLHGHTIAMHIGFRGPAPSVSQVQEAYRERNRRYPGLYQLHADETGPQPARDLTSNDQRVHIGRLKRGEAFGVFGLVAMGHNLVRGAAGAALKNLEAVLEREGQ